jgi:hypothetical protein
MKVKHVNFKVELIGNGIVNYDSGDQKYLWNRESKEGNKNKFTSADNNNMYSKKHYFRREDGVLDYKIKISSDALRKAIFKGDAIATNPSISHHKSLLNSFIGSTMGLVRGYMFPGKTETLKRKSPLTITSAIQTCNGESYMEFHSRSGEKKVGDDSSKSDTTIFNKETIGDIKYKAEGFINLQSLEFLSADPIFDRYSFNSDDYSILKTFLMHTLPNFDTELGYYSLKTSCIDIAEYGLKLNNEQVVFLIKETLKRILVLHIDRASSYVNLSKLRIELVYDPLNSKNNTWIDIQSNEDIDNLNFEVDDNYVLTDESKAKQQRAIIEESIKEEMKKEADKKTKKPLKKDVGKTTEDDSNN